MKKVFIYFKKLSSKWWILLSIIPSIFGTFNFYLGFPEIILSWQSSLIIFLILFFVASYLIWKDEIEEQEKLKDKINEYENKKPKLRLSFENNKNKFILKNKIFERKLDESLGVKRITNPNVLYRLTGGLFEKNPIINEIHEAFLPVKFELHNEGNFKATNVRVDIYFPANLTLIEDLPQQNNFLVPINFPRERTLGIYFQERNHLRLLCNESLHPDYIQFDEVYISTNKKGEFKLKYEIHSEELDSKGIKGELILKTNPIKEVKLYTIKEELEQDQREYEEKLKDQLT